MLLLAAILSAPWHAINIVAGLWGFVGLGGNVYAVIVAWRMRAQIAYRPEFEDWLFRVLLPFAAYAVLAASASATRAHVHEALFGVGGSALLLLFIGIHNAWYAVTYHVFVARRKQQETKRHPRSE